MALPQRKRTRLQEFDYRTDGCYFITICTRRHERILSTIVGEGSPLPQLSSYGHIVDTYIRSIPQQYPNVCVDRYVIMPNHIHLLLTIYNDGRGNPAPTVSRVIGWLKYQSTKTVNASRGTVGESLFQRSFYDHVIRNREDYAETAKYIENNPAKWYMCKQST